MRAPSFLVKMHLKIFVITLLGGLVSRVSHQVQLIAVQFYSIECSTATRVSG